MFASVEVLHIRLHTQNIHLKETSCRFKHFACSKDTIWISEAMITRGRNKIEREESRREKEKKETRYQTTPPSQPNLITHIQPSIPSISSPRGRTRRCSNLVKSLPAVYRGMPFQQWSVSSILRITLHLSFIKTRPLFQHSSRICWAAQAISL